MNRTQDIVAWIGHRIGKPPGWERVVRMVSPPERCAAMPDVRVVRDGASFPAQPGTLIGWHVAFFGTYEPELRNVFRAVLAPGGIAVDAGANVGWHTLLLARLVGGSGRVLAVEPNPSVRARLVANLRENRISHVDVVDCALADAPGTSAFLAPDAGDLRAGDGHLMRRDPGDPMARRHGTRAIEVATSTLDALCADKRLDRLDLLKIDVEGHEWPVLLGAEATIERFRPHVVFEHIDEHAERGGGSTMLLSGFFARHGYRVYAVGRRGAREVGRTGWPRAANLWARPS